MHVKHSNDARNALLFWKNIEFHGRALSRSLGAKVLGTCPAWPRPLTFPSGNSASELRSDESCQKAGKMDAEKEKNAHDT